MGKSQLPVHNQDHIQNQESDQNGSFWFVGCSRIGHLLSFKCVFVLLLSVCVLLVGVFSVLHLHHRQLGFDAKLEIKKSVLRKLEGPNFQFKAARIQAYFRLQKPVSYLLPQITRLEYDIYTEIGVPNTQVSILSLHKASASNWTHVVFGILSNPKNSTIDPVSLSVLRSSLLELFNQRSNLTLTTSIFGQPASFDILKFPGGITVIPPKQSASMWMLTQALFNFSLANSVREIEDNFDELKEQLKSGLQLKPYESVYMQVTNKAGSTKDPPVTVQASILSDLGKLVPLRLKQLAQTITGSPPARNLGLDHSVFGKVKEISLSSYLYHTLDASTPSPAPSPVLNDFAGPTISPSPAISSPQPSPQNGHEPSLPPLPNAPPPSLGRSCGGFKTLPSPPPMYVPRHHSTSPPPMYQKLVMPPDLPPFPFVSYGSRPDQDNGDQEKPAPPPSVSLSMSCKLLFPYSSLLFCCYGCSWLLNLNLG
ncbi:hypothetical protein CTI12_AA100120 [Artemisia annua]|uniref:DUF7036 domain-containing protein n=1 Tax=Artemisia annua TaxID=35608 RepID=A0A2U1PXW9_ARTAN|nr:hypothetical protein CTI12_AA100120 [Artemisia annua]